MAQSIFFKLGFIEVDRIKLFKSFAFEKVRRLWIVQIRKKTGNYVTAPIPVAKKEFAVNA